MVEAALHLRSGDARRAIPRAARSRERSTGFRPTHALPIEVRLYDRLFAKANPDDIAEGETFKDYLNPDSLIVIDRALCGTQRGR